MGQAFDERGNPLGGRIYGDTELEVMTKLVNLHPEASEYRIKKLEDKLKEEIEKFIQEQKNKQEPGEA